MLSLQVSAPFCYHLLSFKRRHVFSVFDTRGRSVLYKIRAISVELCSHSCTFLVRPGVLGLKFSDHYPSFVFFSHLPLAVVRHHLPPPLTMWTVCPPRLRDRGLDSATEPCRHPQ